MGSLEEQIVNAVTIAYDPFGNRGDQTIRSQAIEFLENVRRECAQSWRPALSLFLATNPDDPKEHQFTYEVRIFALSVIAELLDIRCVPTILIAKLTSHLRHSKGSLAPEDFATIKEQFLNYIKREYLYGLAELGGPFMRNKFSQVLTLLFLASYESQWPTFFSDLFVLLKPPPDAQVPPLNAHISIFFFKVLAEISAEVADQLLKNARAFSAERMARDGRVRDLVRERDAQEINAAVLAIVADAKVKLDQIRGEMAEDGLEEKDIEDMLGSDGRLVRDVVELGVRAFASYVRESFEACERSTHLLPADLNSMD